MSADSNKILLLGIGETGIDVVRIIAENKVEGVTVFGIKNESDLKQIVGNVIEEAELVLLVTDLGDNKGNALALKAVELTKGAGKVVAAILTTPRIFEGENKIMRALEVAREISRDADTSLIINKETDTSLPEKACSFAELINSLVPVEETIADCIQNMVSLISESGVVNIDLEDLKTTLSKSGTFVIESGFGAGENRIGIAIESAMSSPLIKKCNIPTARGCLIKILVPKSTPLTIDEMNALSEFIKTLPPRAYIKWGVGDSDDDILVTVIVLATGFDVKLAE